MNTRISLMYKNSDTSGDRWHIWTEIAHLGQQEMLCSPWISSPCCAETPESRLRVDPALPRVGRDSRNILEAPQATPEGPCGRVHVGRSCRKLLSASLSGK